MSRLLEQLSAWKPFTAIVVGDYMLDQLVFGNADRLSPEAPVPVLHVQRSEDRPGGAANVCLDLVAMKATVHALGVTGDDRDADLLRSALVSSRVNADSLVTDASRPTTVKRSLIGLAQHRHPQKMFRVDLESREPLSAEIERALIARFESLVESADVVCIEDYNKGVCTQNLCQAVIRASKKARGGRGVPVLVDPAAIEDYSKYRGCSTITPNRTEASLATGREIADDAAPEKHAPVAKKLMEDLDLEAAVITLDRHGALLLEKGKKALTVPTVARQVYDVTGAGDMVLAALAGARANGISWPDAVRLANAAAGLEVEVFGVVPMSIEKIHREVMLREGAHGGMNGKVRTLDQLLVEVAAHRNDGKKVVFTNGCFDVLHKGHLTLLRRAADEGDFLIVGVNSDESVRRLKGGKDPSRPINNENDRAEMLGGLECVDAVVVFGEDTPAELIRAVGPDVLVKGAEYSVDKVVGADVVQGRGGRVVLVTMVDGKSTTAIVAKAREARSKA
ncbi:MAG TPA: D-glycero-beta-D-manno-heptose 1-phosphate adenylyltransferase [Phycisphaerales bacterium]|nr:D-glycero-beta-D-manno-heptose 1-phosphate adenylyltransferase [Phycisphaerales bacterium]